MSAGIRSGVNWMRLNSSDSASASVRIISVLARPGTPTSRQCPRANSAISSCSITSLLADDALGDFVGDAAIGFAEALDGLEVFGFGHEEVVRCQLSVVRCTIRRLRWL